MSLNFILEKAIRERVVIQLNKGAETSVILNGNYAHGKEMEEAEAYISKLKEQGLTMGEKGVLKLVVKDRVFVYDGKSLNEMPISFTG